MSPARFVLALPRDSLAPLQILREEMPRAKVRAPAWLWTNEAMPVSTVAGGSFIIGHCFSRRGSHRSLDRLDHCPDAQALSQALLRERWGAYLVLVRDAGSGRWQAMCDPSGLLPVFRLLTSSHAILSSDAALLEQASGIKLSISWNSVLDHLMQPDLRQRATCLAGVDELPPGVLLDPCAQDAPEQALWTPGDHLPTHEALPFEAARDELRAVAINVLAAWQDVLGPVAVAVSGGVDSSFVCGALAAGGYEFGCITLATSDASGDERHFARLLASHLGRPLKELMYDPTALGPHVFASQGLPRPSRRTFVSVVDRMLASCAADLGAAVVLDGNSGDNLFCYLHSAAPVADRLRSEGPGRGAFSTLLDMCRVTGCDIPTIAAETLRKLRRYSTEPPFEPDTRFLATDEGQSTAVGSLVGWPNLVAASYPGKRDHVALIARGLHHIHGVSCHAPRFSPLMSQPLLEACLRIPTWLWPKGGVNRALARSAFAAELPPELFTRTAKPGPDSFILRAFERNRGETMAMLRDGLLAENGLLDIRQLDQFRKGEAANDWRTVRRLIDLAEAENWARSWQA